MQFQPDGVVCFHPDLRRRNDVADPETIHRHLGQPFEVDGHARAVDGHVADGDIAKHRCSFRNGFFDGHLDVFRRHHVEAHDIDAPADVFHGPVIESDVFDDSAPPAPALDANAHLGAIAGDVAGHQVADAS